LHQELHNHFGYGKVGKAMRQDNRILRGNG